MTKDSEPDLAVRVQHALENLGYVLLSSDPMPKTASVQLRFTTGEIVNVFETGTVNAQGQNVEQMKSRLLTLGYGSKKSKAAAAMASARTPPTMVASPASPMVAVAVLVRHGDEVLFTRSVPVDPGSESNWSAPVRPLDMGESLEDAATAVVEDELGVEVSGLKFRAITNDADEDKTWHWVTVWFEGDLVGDRSGVSVVKGLNEICWAKLNEAPWPMSEEVESLIKGRGYPKPSG